MNVDELPHFRAGEEYICTDCQQTYIHKYTTRPLNDNGVKQVGSACPHCGHFRHICVENAQVRRYRSTFEKREAEIKRKLKPTPGDQRALQKAAQQYLIVFRALQLEYKAAVGGEYSEGSGAGEEKAIV